MSGPGRVGASILLLFALLSACGGNEDGATASQASRSDPTASPTTRVSGTNPIRYLALGDSLTQGVGAVDEQTGSFPALLSQRWRDDGCEVELSNVGSSGYTAGQILAEQVPQIEAFEPTIITFQAGGNDIVNAIPVDEYRTNVGAVLDAAAASGARVIVLAQNDWFRSPEGQIYGPVFAAQRETFDSALIEEATSRGIEFVDLRPLYATQADDGQWVEDGIHPTPEAYAAWSDALAEEIPAPCR